MQMFTAWMEVQFTRGSKFVISYLMESYVDILVITRSLSTSSSFQP